MSYKKEFLKELRNERKSYKDMVNFCCDSLIMNNNIIQELDKKEIYFDIYQYFIIDGYAADRFAEYTNEIVFYNSDLDMYVLGVTHCGTGWDYVPASWKELDEMGEDGE